MLNKGKLQVNSVDELKRVTKDFGAEFYILLNGGLKSSKFIQWLETANKFAIFNLIDGSEQLLTEAELFTESNIGEAIKKHALIYEA